MIFPVVALLAKIAVAESSFAVNIVQFLLTLNSNKD
jgi:hypothetical protein